MSSWNKKKRKRKRKTWNTVSSQAKKPKLDPSPKSNLWTTQESCLKWLLSTDNTTDFIDNYWSKQPFLVQRQDTNYYKRKGVAVDLQTVYSIIEQNEDHFTFGPNVILKYYNRSNQNEVVCVNRGEPVKLDEIKTLFADKAHGATIQFLHPHFYHYEIGHLIYNLESFFGNFVSSNIYVTPCDQQGLQPHWDDIEAFILQLKGKKRWKLYEIKGAKDQFPINESLHKLAVEDTTKYSLIFECTLNEGDLLYFPRGCVHFAECVDDDEYSLHLTISTNQNNHYGQWMKTLTQVCLDQMMNANIDYRRNIPINSIMNVGNNINTAHCKNDNGAQTKANDFTSEMKQLWERMKQSMDAKFNIFLQQISDKEAVDFVSNRFPPPQFLAPHDFIVYGNERNKLEKEKVIEPKMVAKDALIEDIEENERRSVIINESVSVKLVNPNWMRIVQVQDVNKKAKTRDEVESFLVDDDDANDDDVKETDDDLEEVELEQQYGDDLLLYYCNRNNHKTHSMAYNEDVSSQPMMATANDRMLFTVLRAQYPQWMTVKELMDKSNQESSSEDFIDMQRCCDLLFALWAEGLLQTKQYD